MAHVAASDSPVYEANQLRFSLFYRFRILFFYPTENGLPHNTTLLATLPCLPLAPTPTPALLRLSCVACVNFCPGLCTPCSHRIRLYFPRVFYTVLFCRYTLTIYFFPVFLPCRHSGVYVLPYRRTGVYSVSLNRFFWCCNTMPLNLFFLGSRLWRACSGSTRTGWRGWICCRLLSGTSRKR